MAVSFKRTLMEILTDWPDDLPLEGWHACGEVEFGFGNADSQLELWEPVFPVRRGRNFSRLRDRPPAHNGADVGLREPRRSQGALRCDVRRPRLARVHRRDLEIEAILADDAMIMNPTRFAQVVAMEWV